jgi:hypothetical protein
LEQGEGEKQKRRKKRQKRKKRKRSKQRITARKFMELKSLPNFKEKKIVTKKMESFHLGYWFFFFSSLFFYIPFTQLV